MSPVAVELQASYVLHTRAYRDTSLLVTILTKNHGKLNLIARGARKTSKSSSNPRYLLQPFIPLLLSWQGKGSLKTLTSKEASSNTLSMQGERLYSAMYANELLVYLLQEGDPSEDIYHLYEELLTTLSLPSVLLEPCLRDFEFSLLSALGYEINFFTDAESDAPLHSQYHYYYLPNLGFVDINNHPEIRDIYFDGRVLLCIGNGDYSTLEARQAAKIIARAALSPHLQNRPLKSRELFSKH